MIVSRVVKVPSVPADPSQGVLSALNRLAETFGCSVHDVLRDCALFVHGSTVATVGERTQELGPERLGFRRADGHAGHLAASIGLHPPAIITATDKILLPSRTLT